MKGGIAIIGSVFVSAALGQSNFRCPEKEGYFEDLVQCDKYYVCRDGVAQEQLCPDGLVFDPYSRKKPPLLCDHYFNVDCGDRTDLQPARGQSDLCPRLNGFYAHPDPAVCHIFYSCVDGLAEEYTCSAGLWYDEYSGVCNWPTSTEREGCEAKSYALDTASGFECPPAPPADQYGNQDPHPKYPNLENCGTFFVCHNNISPREQGCELGEVYNTQTLACDSPENVPECRDYYKFLEDDKPTEERESYRKRK